MPKAVELAVQEELYRARSQLSSAKVFKRDFDATYAERRKVAHRLLIELRSMRRRNAGVDHEIAVLETKIEQLSIGNSDYIARLEERIRIGGLSATERRERAQALRKQRLKDRIAKLRAQLVTLEPTDPAVTA